MIVHAGLLALWSGGGWRGVLVEGPSGSGKSDVAIRCLDQGFRLVADDRVLLWVSEGRLFGRAPDALSGLVEVRGIDVLIEPALRFAEVILEVGAGAPDRVAADTFVERLGVVLPRLDLPLTEPSAPAKLRRAVARFDGVAKRGI